MTNALDYLAWRGDLSFEASPFCEVDMFICSQLSTPDWCGIVCGGEPPVPLKKAAERYFATHEGGADSLGALQSEFVLPMLRALPDTIRYSGVLLKNAVNKVDMECEEQFSAVTLEFPDGSCCVSVRGTDDTIVAWKEDFNLATKKTVPAQKDASEYLLRAAEECSGRMLVCGHSKGGNLAVYAAASVPESVQERIEQAVSFDGPGFSREFLASEGYGRISGKVKTVRSQNSFVGTLLYPAGEIITVNSCKTGPMAHDGFSWQVIGNKFVREQGLSEISALFEKTMDETLSAMGRDEKQAFTDELFDTLLSTGAVTVSDITDFSPQQIIELLKDFRDDKKVQKFGAAVAERMIKIGMRDTKDSLAEKRGELAVRVKDAGESIAEKSGAFADLVREKSGNIAAEMKEQIKSGRKAGGNADGQS